MLVTATFTAPAACAGPARARQRGGTPHDRRTEGGAIVGESSAGVVPQPDRKTEVLTQPAIDSRRRVQAKLDGGFTLQKPNLLKPRSKLATQRVDKSRSFPIYHAPFFVKDRVDPVVFENTPFGNRHFIQLNAVQGLDGKNQNSPKAHRAISIKCGTACNTCRRARWRAVWFSAEKVELSVHGRPEMTIYLSGESRGTSLVARQTHNPAAAGRYNSRQSVCSFFRSARF